MLISACFRSVLVDYRLLIILVFLHRLSKNYKNPWIITNEVSQAWLNRNQKGENYE